MRPHGKQKLWESENILLSSARLNSVQMRKLQFVLSRRGIIRGLIIHPECLSDFGLECIQMIVFCFVCFVCFVMCRADKPG